MVKVRYVDLYSALDDNYLVLKALRHRSHSLKPFRYCSIPTCRILAEVMKQKVYKNVIFDTHVWAQYTANVVFVALFLFFVFC